MRSANVRCGFWLSERRIAALSGQLVAADTPGWDLPGADLPPDELPFFGVKSFVLPALASFVSAWTCAFEAAGGVLRDGGWSA